MYNKWNLSPDISTFTEKKASVWTIPFPAVTICPETKVKKSNLDFTKCHKTIKNTPPGESFNLTDDELIKMEAMAQVCDPHLLYGHNISSGLELDDIVPTLQQITPELNQTMLFCLWRNNLKDCDKLFTEIITDEGSCQTFNMLDSTEIYRED